jgi:sialidase-1
MSEPFFEKSDVFTARTHGFFTYRIPTIVVTQKGTILAFAEARVDNTSDWAEISIVMRRSLDNGNSWGPLIKVASNEKETTHNMVAIISNDSNIIHFLYCVGYKRIFYMESKDDGQSFSKPKEINQIFEEFKPDFKYKVKPKYKGKYRIIATGPGHGIQLTNGRLIVPVWMAKRHIHRPSVISVIYSDDRGKTWKRSEVILGKLENPSETVAVQLSDGSVLLNIRNESKICRRAISVSKDGISNWSEPVFDDTLLEPVCFGSIIRLTSKENEDKNRILFVNPDSIEGDPTELFNLRPRQNLTVKLSYDECKTWPVSKSIEPGSSGYADIAVGKDYTIYCLYERDCPIEKDFDTTAMTIARFNLEWLTDNNEDKIILNSA